MTPLRPETLFCGPDGPRIVGAEGEVLEEVDSTMRVARERLMEGAAEGYVVLAENQTAGRGRTGGWECPPGLGVLVSVVLRLGIPATDRQLVGIMGAVSACEAVRRFGVPALIKWPNDVVVSEEADGDLRVRKLGGMLVERVTRADGSAAHVLGIGLNVNQTPGDLPEDAVLAPTSMRIERAREFDRNAVCRALLEELDGWYRRLARGQREHILARWRTHSCLLSRRVRVQTPDGVLSGKVAGIRSTGELIFTTDDGRRLLLSDDRAKLQL